ncbi:hypothetical protein LQ948_08015 [Jiella sp. MQZ9-1]|uniref:Transporter n=1 Tax=Jiella flava TaxID=2816857 RepID=A0A939G055_9HYPH|nr:hypothetical protein [Jiella flava]MBO0662732.1 hypothetical protein [Jiella flava]MCD2471154.1 hypothetical protein [Jiella flava]
MPSFEDVLRFFSGALQLMLGQPEGLRRLDLSADGFWQSFAAMVVALPPVALSWVASESGDKPDAVANMSGIAIYGAHAFADGVSWLLPVVILMLVAKPIGFSRKIVPLVVATNWGGALLAWTMTPYWLIAIVLGPGDGMAMLGLIVTIAAVTLTMRLIYFALGRDFPTAVAVTMLMVVASLITYGAVMDVTGVPLV